MNALNKASSLMDTLQSDVPALLNKVDTIATNVSGMVDNVSGMVDSLKEVPGHVNLLLSKLDTTVGRVDGMVDNIGNVSTSLTDFISSSEETLENADDLMTGISNIWLIRRSIPSKDTVPFMVETLW
jgi:phospholipid/cholesterol/gamma-HCH transport system substrate-binding protein